MKNNAYCPNRGWRGISRVLGLGKTDWLEGSEHLEPWAKGWPCKGSPQPKQNTSGLLPLGLSPLYRWGKWVTARLRIGFFTFLLFFTFWISLRASFLIYSISFWLSSSLFWGALRLCCNQGHTLKGVLFLDQDSEMIMFSVGRFSYCLRGQG